MELTHHNQHFVLCRHPGHRNEVALDFFAIDDDAGDALLDAVLVLYLDVQLLPRNSRTMEKSVQSEGTHGSRRRPSFCG